ncbi:Gfo/Idh/MocA family protein [Kitasatospora sp. SUK 42]|uniref:Gfo/Idh/MocA family protein n=1 Tax=Kitasatospora sp. SUK 42 TaxID=1588882 RepID=UPI0018CAF575|nr:Gfo/Idh/MocA family oxidoreductase [Kitasatospora sp. SUK 42]MBV2156626.1 Gfo/Idh/MocA family oxidoreductase [Kitasatospora sp. SUK 42]
MTAPATGERRLRVGIIGTGVGVRTHLPGFASTGRADVVAIAGSSPARAREVAAEVGVPTAYEDYRALCEDRTLDVICVASPNEHHYDHFAAAAASGRHIIVEKPVGGDAEALRRLMGIPLADGQLVLVDHQLRFNPYLSALRESLAAGELGRPYLVRIHQQGVGQLSQDVLHAWQFDAGRGGGVRLAMGSHLVDLVDFLLGRRPWEAVAGSVDPVVPFRRDREGALRPVTADSAFSALLRAADTTALVSASAAAAATTLLDVDVLGTAGEAHFSLTGKLRISTTSGTRTVLHPPGVDQVEVDNRISVFKSSFNHLARALTSAVLDGDLGAVAHAGTLADQLSVLGTLDAILRSAAANPSPHKESSC